MEYIEVTIYASKQGIDPVLSMLLANGIADVTILDPSEVDELLEKRNEYDWDFIDSSVLELKDEEPKVTFYLQNDDEGKIKLQQIKEATMKLKSKELEGFFGWDASLGRLYCEANTVNDSDWKDNWKEYFKPAKITDRLVVKPSWEEYTPEKGQLVIELDPGMAFGTGTHETTSLCLKLLEKYEATDKKVLDVGSGSAILSIAAALLGAKEVLGIDIDPVAIEVGTENIAKNGLEGVVKLKQGDLTKGIDFSADIVLANIMADIIKLLSKDVQKHLEKGGIFISSGILIEQKDDVCQAVGNNGFEILEVLEDGEWCAIAARLN